MTNRQLWKSKIFETEFIRSMPNLSSGKQSVFTMTRDPISERSFILLPWRKLPLQLYQEIGMFMTNGNGN
ncbi:hypothetical protein FGO68_gene12616 [Halteria grandinella]|uniref:Uncharacterized protein n=1 Tax=Halteria grandinella TaxID=5974 RepID=A0A8J8NM58_HALGN|nr:hypothetical protein FGO68_gene12616 [Halteria grandinella]